MGLVLYGGMASDMGEWGLLFLISSYVHVHASDVCMDGCTCCM